MKKTILIDLDGVLNKYKGNYQENFIPAPANGVENFLNTLSQKFNIVVFTTRNSEFVFQWLKENSLDKYITEITNTKKPCFLYIDDRAICHKGNFNSTIEQINNFNVYWKKTNL